MNPWEGIASQVLGMGLGAQQQEVDYAQRAYGAGMVYPYSSGNCIPLSATTTTSNALYIDGTDMNDVIEERVEKPLDEFTQLSNHRFHELLDRFYKLAQGEAT